MNEHLNDIIHSISKGDTTLAESFFSSPYGRRYLENLTLILLNTLAPLYPEKEEMYSDFVKVLDHMEHRIQRQQEGQQILEAVLPGTWVR